MLCDNIQPCRWLSIDRHHLLFDGTENSCITCLLKHYKTLTDPSQSPKELCDHIRSYTASTSFDVIDCHIGYHHHHSLNYSYDNSAMIAQCEETIHEIVSHFDPTIVIMASPVVSRVMEYSADPLYSLCPSKFYTVHWNIVQAQGNVYPSSLIIFVVKCTYHTDNLECSSIQTSLTFEDHTTFSSVSKSSQTPLVNPSIWTRILEFVCRYYLAPILMSEGEQRVKASVFLTHTSPTHKDWLQEYKKDTDINLLLNHLSISTKPFDPELSKAVRRCYRTHLRETEFTYSITNWYAIYQSEEKID